MKRILYCVAVGKPRFGEMALGLARSLSLLGDRTPRVIVTDFQGMPWERHFDIVMPPNGARSALDKLTGIERTDADAVLALDVDMLAFRPLSDIFEHCQGKPFAIQGLLRSNGRFHGVEVPELLKRYGVSSFPIFNGGMAYYERSAEFSSLLSEMRSAEATYGDLGFNWFRGSVSEEVCMAHAMVRTGIGELIDPDLQFQHSAAGLIGKLRLDVLANECSFVARQQETRFWRPYLFHAWRYKDFLAYWRELKKLEKLFEYEAKRPPMYISQGSRWVRTFHRMILRWKGRAE